MDVPPPGVMCRCLRAPHATRLLSTSNIAEHDERPCYYFYEMAKAISVDDKLSFHRLLQEQMPWDTTHAFRAFSYLIDCSERPGHDNALVMLHLLMEIKFPKLSMNELNHLYRDVRTQALDLAKRGALQTFKKLLPTQIGDAIAFKCPEFFPDVRSLALQFGHSAFLRTLVSDYGVPFGPLGKPQSNSRGLDPESMLQFFSDILDRDMATGVFQSNCIDYLGLAVENGCLPVIKRLLATKMYMRSTIIPLLRNAMETSRVLIAGTLIEYLKQVHPLLSCQNLSMSVPPADVLDRLFRLWSTRSFLDIDMCSPYSPEMICNFLIPRKADGSPVFERHFLAELLDRNCLIHISLATARKIFKHAVKHRLVDVLAALLSKCPHVTERFRGKDWQEMFFPPDSTVLDERFVETVRIIAQQYDAHTNRSTAAFVNIILQGIVSNAGCFPQEYDNRRRADLVESIIDCGAHLENEIMQYELLLYAVLRPNEHLLRLLIYREVGFGNRDMDFMHAVREPSELGCVSLVSEYLVHQFSLNAAFEYSKAIIVRLLTSLASYEYQPVELLAVCIISGSTIELGLEDLGGRAEFEQGDNPIARKLYYLREYVREYAMKYTAQRIECEPGEPTRACISMVRASLPAGTHDCMRSYLERAEQLNLWLREPADQKVLARQFAQQFSQNYRCQGLRQRLLQWQTSNAELLKEVEQTCDILEDRYCCDLVKPEF